MQKQALETPVLHGLANKSISGGNFWPIRANFTNPAEPPALGQAADQTVSGLRTEDVIRTHIRSHAPVRADGATPFDRTVALGGMSCQALTLTLKHRF